MNNKPTVIPELREWKGAEGTFEMKESSRIIVNPNALEFMRAAEQMAEDYRDIFGKEIEVAEGTEAAAGDFYFRKAGEGLGKEEYILKIEDAAEIAADEYAGAYWATRSALQILKQTGGTIPMGTAKDYPKYRVRGFMLDVGRMPVKMSFLKLLVKTMAWYKLNDFQVHLNDNALTNKDGKPDYAGFRIESDVPNLTNTDVFYTKDEFRTFINESKEMGVEIVPEFDSPGHSGAFTRAWPELTRGYGTEKSEGDYLDIENKIDEVLEKMKALFAEYMTGENPVYPKGTVVHVGTDEFKRGDKEAFRYYQDQMLRYVRDELGYKPRVWGSQTENEGETPITVDGVQMSMWYKGYADPKEMYELGYDMINTNDDDLYIVPKAGYYRDYLDKKHIYGTWKPNVIAGFEVPEDDKQMLGACFCLWNDKPALILENDMSEIEMFDRIYHITPLFGAKLWGDIRDYALEELDEIAEKTGYAPNTNPPLRAK